MRKKTFVLALCRLLFVESIFIIVCCFPPYMLEHTKIHEILWREDVITVITVCAILHNSPRYGLLFKVLNCWELDNSLQGAFNCLLDLMQFTYFYCLLFSLNVHIGYNVIIVVCTNLSSCMYCANCTFHNYLIGIFSLGYFLVFLWFSRLICGMLWMSFTETACSEQPITVLTASKFVHENRRNP